MNPSEAFDRSTVATTLFGGAVAVAAAFVVADRSVAITSQTPLIVGGIVGAVAASAWMLRATRVNPPPRLRACCVVHLRSSDNSLRMVCSFPIEASDGFASVPNLLHSMNPEAVGVRWAEGTSRAGDTLILMSDAVACWALAAPDNLARVASLGEDALTQTLIESRRNH